jgi:hypothetical protein
MGNLVGDFDVNRITTFINAMPAIIKIVKYLTIW